MSAIGGLRARLRSVLAPGAAESRTEEEFRFHMEMEAKRLERDGLGADEARRRAVATFGGSDYHREMMRDQRGSRWLTDVWLDVKYAARSMKRTPALALAVALTFGLGVGVNGIVFSFVNTLLFRPLPVEKPEELVAMYVRDTKSGDADPISYEDWKLYRARSGVFADVAAHNGLPINMVVDGGAADMIWGEVATENFFSVLRMRPAIGRFFTEADGTSGNPYAVLAYHTWQRRFAGDSTVIGRRVRLNGTEFTIVGVAAKGFHGMRSFGFWTEMFVPIGMINVLAPRMSITGHGSGFLLTTGRMKPEATIASTQVAASSFAKGLQSEFPATNTGLDVIVLSARTGFDNPSAVSPKVLTLVSATGLLAASMILLLICANLANVQLARAAAREREIGIRLSLGCTRARLARQLLVESLVLALPGACIGSAFILASPLIERTLLPKLPFAIGFDSRPDFRVLGFTAAIAVIAMVLIGLIPSLRATKRDITASLTNVIGTKRRSRGAPVRLRSALVVGQLFMAMVLLIGGTLFVRSLLAVRSADVGFDHENRLLASVNVDLQGYDPARGRRFFDDVITRVRALPAVQSAGWAFPVPFDGFGSAVVLYVDGMPITSHDSGFAAPASFVGEGAIGALGLRLRSGRDFRAADSAGVDRVMVVSKSLGAKLWPGKDPLGQRARLGGPSGPEIIATGVVDDARFTIIGTSSIPHVYIPSGQRYRGSSTLVIKTSGAPQTLVPQIRAIVGSADPSLPIYGIGTLSDNVRTGSALPAIAAWIFGSFSLIALLIASVGLYAVVASTVAERTREIGVRIALGSTPGQVLTLVMKGSARLALIGVVIGLAAGFALARAMAKLLVGLSPSDPITFATVPITLVVVALIASYLPARRAVNLDPVTTLRGD